MASLFYPFRRKHCTLPIPLEMGKINNQLLYFPSSSFTKNVLQKTQEMAFPIISGQACAQTPPGLGHLRRCNFSSPAYTFKIPRYAADYQYFIKLMKSMPKNGRREKRTWSRRDWREGGVHLT